MQGWQTDSYGNIKSEESKDKVGR